MRCFMERLEQYQLEHTTPESVGVDSNAITAFINEINEKGLGLQSFTVVRHDKVCAQGYPTCSLFNEQVCYFNGYRFCR